jgi:hypothetical protein
MNYRQLFSILIVSAGLTTSAFAQTNSPGGEANEHKDSGMNEQAQPGGPGPGGQNGPHRGPPPAAIDACKGKAAGAQCSFVGRNNQTLTGTCFVPPAIGQNGMPLACRPALGGMAIGGPGNQNKQVMQGQAGATNGEQEHEKKE